MRTVLIEAEVEVLVPVRVNVDIYVHADDDADILVTVNRWAKREKFTNADIQDVQIEETVRIGESGIENDLDNAELTEALNQAIFCHINGTAKLKLLSHKVTDSR